MHLATLALLTLASAFRWRRGRHARRWTNLTRRDHTSIWLQNQRKFCIYLQGFWIRFRFLQGRLRIRKFLVSGVLGLIFCQNQDLPPPLGNLLLSDPWYLALLGCPESRDSQQTHFHSSPNCFGPSCLQGSTCKKSLRVSGSRGKSCNLQQGENVDCKSGIRKESGMKQRRMRGTMSNTYMTLWGIKSPLLIQIRIVHFFLVAEKSTKSSTC